MKKISVSLFVSLFVVFSLTSFANGNYQKGNKKKNKEVISVNTSDFEKQAPELVGKAISITGTVTAYGKNKEKVLFLANDSGHKIRVNAAKKSAPFTGDLEGKKVQINGMVKEIIIDEIYINKIKNEKRANKLRAQLAESGKDHLSAYTVIAKSYKVVE